MVAAAPVRLASGGQERSEYVREQFHAFARADPGIDRSGIDLLLLVVRPLAAVRPAVGEDAPVVDAAEHLVDQVSLRPRSTAPAGPVARMSGLLAGAPAIGRTLLRFETAQARDEAAEVGADLHQVLVQLGCPARQCRVARRRARRCAPRSSASSSRLRPSCSPFFPRVAASNAPCSLSWPFSAESCTWSAKWPIAESSPNRSPSAPAIRETSSRPCSTLWPAAIPRRSFPSTFPRFRSSLRPARTAFFRIVSSFASPCSADFLAFVAPGALAGLCSGLARCRAFSSLAMLSSISRSCAPSPRKSWAPPSRLYFACKDRSSALTALASARTFSTCGLASSSPIAPAKAITLPCTAKMARVLR